MLITKEPNAETEISKTYILAGGVFFLVLFLFVIVLQLYTCKRSTAPRSKAIKKRTNKYNGQSKKIETTAESADAVHTIHEHINRNEIYVPDESSYQEIDHVVEMIASSNYSIASQEYEAPLPLSRSRHTNYSPLEKTIHHLPQPNDQNAEPPNCDKNESNLYLHPINMYKS